jgi:hypothetical protein
MFGSLNKTKLIKNDLKGIAKLMYQDVSVDTWDQENLTKRNLDFTIESIRYIDAYTKRLSTTQMGRELLKNHFDNFCGKDRCVYWRSYKKEYKSRL